jgi:hypothetical protein
VMMKLKDWDDTGTNKMVKENIEEIGLVLD